MASGLGLDVGGRTVLSDISLRLPAGRLTVVIGGNGAGKSTLLRILAGLIRPHRGSVQLGEHILSTLPAGRRAIMIAHLPQGPAVTWAVAARDLVAIGRLPHGLMLSASRWGDADQRAIESAMLRTGTSALAGRRVDQLSHGERARLLLARVLTTDAGVLLLDEPVASLDPAQAMAMMHVLAGEAASGKAVVVVMHDLVLAQRFADYAILLHRGCAMAQGEPREVFTEANLGAAYDVTMQQVQIGGRPVLLPLEARTTAQADRP